MPNIMVPKQANASGSGGANTQKKQLSVALIGTGYAGRLQLRGWKSLSNARLVGVYDKTFKHAQEVEKLFDTPAYSDLVELINHPDVDAVDIATPAETHAEVAAIAAAAGKAVLSQKPLATNYSEAKQMVDTCDTAGIRLMANENWRWRQWFRKTREILDQGILGSIHYVHFDYRPQRISMPVPLILFVATHHIDTIRYLFGEPTDVFARKFLIREDNDWSATGKFGIVKSTRTEDIASMSFGYPNCIVQLDLSWLSIVPKDLQPDLLSIEGSKASFTLSRDGRINIYHLDGKAEVIDLSDPDYYQKSWTASLAHFAECILEEKPFETSGAQYLETLSIAFAAYESERIGRPVRITDFEPKQ